MPADEWEVHMSIPQWSCSGNTIGAIKSEAIETSEAIASRILAPGGG